MRFVIEDDSRELSPLWYAAFKAMAQRNQIRVWFDFVVNKFFFFRVARFGCFSFDSERFFLLRRYGRPMHVAATLMSVFYLVVLLIAELIAVGTCVSSLCPGFPPIAAMLSIAIVTNFYSAVGGFPASMLADK